MKTFQARGGIANSERYEVPCYETSNPELVIHRAIISQDPLKLGSCWDISHKRSGMTARRNFGQLREAKTFVERMPTAPWDLIGDDGSITDHTKTPITVYDACRQAIGR